MAEGKYGKYILRQTKATGKGPSVMPVALEGQKDWAGIGHRMVWSHVVQPGQFGQELHSHDFEEFYCFLGNDARDSFDFGAEVEVSLGKEGEKQTIDHTSIVCVPKGLIHGPINFKKVTKPILFCNIYMAPEHRMKKA